MNCSAVELKADKHGQAGNWWRWSAFVRWCTSHTGIQIESSSSSSSSIFITGTSNVSSTNSPTTSNTSWTDNDTLLFSLCTLYTTATGSAAAAAAAAGNVKARNHKVSKGIQKVIGAIVLVERQRGAYLLSIGLDGRKWLDYGYLPTSTTSLLADKYCWC